MYTSIPNMSEKKKKSRDSSIELLRIILMLMIIASHFSIHGGFNFINTELSIPRFWLKFLELGGYFGVDLFVLISGYYLITDNQFEVNVNKILKFWGHIIFYSLSIFIISRLVGINIGGMKFLVRTFFPLIFEQWWFASTYFVMFLIHPFINRFLQSLDKNQYKYYLTIVISLWIIIPTLTTSNFQSNALIEFLVYYSIAGYIRLHGFLKEYTCKKWLTLWALFTLITYGSCVIFLIIGTQYNFFSEHATFFYGRDSILTIIRAVCLFMGFKKMNIKSNNVINVIASTTFGVYLLHDNEVFRILLWERIFKNSMFQNNVNVIPYSMYVIVMVFFVCSIIELIRQKTVEKVYMKCVKRIF